MLIISSGHHQLETCLSSVLEKRHGVVLTDVALHSKSAVQVIEAVIMTPYHIIALGDRLDEHCASALSQRLGPVGLMLRVDHVVLSGQQAAQAVSELLSCARRRLPLSQDDTLSICERLANNGSDLDGSAVRYQWSQAIKNGDYPLLPRPVLSPTHGMQHPHNIQTKS